MIDFTLNELSQAINILPNTYNKVTALGLFPARPLTVNFITIEQQNNVLNMVPTRPWGAPATKNFMGKRNVRSFQVPHTPIEDLLKASEIMGVRAFGSSTALETVAGRVNEKLQSMKNKIDQTMEFRQISALKGIVLDADATTVIENYFTSFGIAQKTVDFVLGTPTTDVRGKCVEVVRYMEDNLQGERMTGVHALVSSEFFDKLINHATVKELYMGWAAAADYTKNPNGTFQFGGINFEEYRGSVGSIRFIAANEGHAFPLGTTETFANFLAPADFLETVNTLAIPYYARQGVVDFNRGVALHAQANQLPMVMRPGVLVKLTTSN